MKKLLLNLFLLFVTLVGFAVGGLYLSNLHTLGKAQESPSQTQLVQAQPEVAEPIRLVIPSLGLDIVIEQVGMDDTGKMGVPVEVGNAGWWKYGAKPGEKGSAVLAGHVDTPDGQFGIFYELEKLLPGDQILVYDAEGIVHIYEVDFVQVYPDEESLKETTQSG
jgi:sortase (surface protein transpeptidase)